MSKPQGPNKAMHNATRHRFIEHAHLSFVEKGYAATSTNDIVRDVGMARGALYHHFKNKEALFLAVYEEKMSDMHEQLVSVLEESHLAGTVSAQSNLTTALHFIIELFKDPSYRRILILEPLIALPYAKRSEVVRNVFHTMFVSFFEQLPITEESTKGHINALITGLYGFIAENSRNYENAETPEQLNQLTHDTKAALDSLIIPFFNTAPK
jgi:AcrR family transcriptional regulator